MPRKLNLHLDDETDAILQAKMAAHGFDQSTLVRHAVRAYDDTPSKNPWLPYKHADALACIDLETVLPEQMQISGRSFYLKFGFEVMRVTLP